METCRSPAGKRGEDQKARQLCSPPFEIIRNPRRLVYQGWDQGRDAEAGNSVEPVSMSCECHTKKSGLSS